MYSQKLKEMERQQEAALANATEIRAKASAENRELTDNENGLIGSHIAMARRVEAGIQQYKANNTLFQQVHEYGPGFLLDAGRLRPNDPTPTSGIQAPFVNMERFNMELGDFMRGMSATTDTPVYVGTGAGVESVGAMIPTQVLAYIPAYYNLDSFALAGARQINTDNTIPLSMPIISAGAAASTYNEGAAPTNSQPFQVDAFTFNGAKYSRLVKVSDEALMNSAIPLQGAILDELTASIATTFTAAITTAMLAALAANSSVLVAEGSNDIYKTLGAVMHAIPPRFALPTDKWMLSRATLAKIKDQRATGSGVPLFDPSTNQIFQKDVVINDNLSGGQVAFGDWMNGAIIRKSPFLLLPLREAYASSGEVGFRATQFLDQHFLCERSDVPNQPLYYTVLS